MMCSTHQRLHRTNIKCENKNKQTEEEIKKIRARQTEFVSIALSAAAPSALYQRHQWLISVSASIWTVSVCVRYRIKNMLHSIPMRACSFYVPLLMQRARRGFTSVRDFYVPKNVWMALAQIIQRFSVCVCVCREVNERTDGRTGSRSCREMRWFNWFVLVHYVNVFRVGFLADCVRAYGTMHVPIKRLCVP